MNVMAPSLPHPPLPHPPPLWRESRFAFEAAALFRSRVYKGDGIEDAGGQPVMLIPGFLAGDDSLGLMTQWLRRTGHRTKRAGIRSNVDCSSASVERLAERLDCLAETSGQRVAIIGQSRGGNLAKVLAVRYPELVSGIVTLGSPQLDPFDIHPLVRVQVYAVGALGTLGMKGLFKHSCKNGACCEALLGAARRPDAPWRRLPVGLLEERRRGALARLPRPGGRAPRDQGLTRRDGGAPARIPGDRRRAGGLPRRR